MKLPEGTQYESARTVRKPHRVFAGSFHSVRQSNIQFRHVVNDMILDPEKRKAMVKWLAEFDNVRYRCLASRATSGLWWLC